MVHFTHGVFSLMVAWKHEALDEAVAQHRDSLEYAWPLAGAKANEGTTHTRCETGSPSVTQVNTCAKMVQPMLYLPDDTLSHVAIARRLSIREAASATR